MRHAYRLSKDDPSRRGERGDFRDETWTFFAPVGRVVDGKRVTMREWKRVEDAYVEVLRAVLDELGIGEVRLRDAFAASWAEPAWRRDRTLDRGGALRFTRAALRERASGHLHVPRRLWIEFGWDLVVSIGSSRPLVEPALVAAGEGLFLEANEGRLAPGAARTAGD